ncbi:hypothetical protein EG329_000963 [Mollisiaceae sp. DMI_Dod_QoI]|nr:hypothetical protein EG329_000963 [Helotiales sp. DMI_Dod_QoI]
MSTDTSAGKDLGISSQVNVAQGVHLSAGQKVLVGSVLDLFAGKPSLPKLRLWTDDATFADPLTQAQGRKQFQAQWYGLQAAFSEINQLHSQVTSAGNPILLDLKTRYVVKGLGKEQIVNSVVRIHTEGVEGGEEADEMGTGLRIRQVEDRWDGEIPDGPIAKVFRNLNSVVVPALVSVPKNAEEEKK